MTGYDQLSIKMYCLLILIVMSFMSITSINKKEKIA